MCVHIALSLDFCVLFVDDNLSVCIFLLLAIVLSGLWITVDDYSFGIFKISIYTCACSDDKTSGYNIVYITEIPLSSSIIIYICYSDHLLFFMQHAEKALFSLYAGTAGILPVYC